MQFQNDAENTENLVQTDLKSPEASRGRRSAWGRRYHAAPVEGAIYRMVRAQKKKNRIKRKQLFG